MAESSTSGSNRISLTRPDIAAAEQLIQLSGDTDENGIGEDGEEYEAEKEQQENVTSPLPALDVKNSHGFQDTFQRRKRRFSSIAYIYRRTQPVKVKYKRMRSAEAADG